MVVIRVGHDNDGYCCLLPPCSPDLVNSRFGKFGGLVREGRGGECTGGEESLADSVRCRRELEVVTTVRGALLVAHRYLVPTFIIVERDRWRTDGTPFVKAVMAGASTWSLF